MKPGPRARRALAVAAVLFTLAVLVPRVLTHTPYARLGVSLDYRRDNSAPVVVQVLGPPAEGLLKVGDRLISVDGVGFNSPILRPGVQRPGLPRGPFTLRVERSDFRFDVVVPPVRLSAWQRIRILMLPLGAVVAAPLAAFALVWRRPDLRTAWVFLWFASLQAVSVVHQIYSHPEFESIGAFRFYLGAYGWLVCWMPAAFLHFMAVFPRPRSPQWRWRKLVIALVAIAYLAPVYFVARLVATGVRPEQPFMIFDTICVLLGVALLIERYGLAGRGDWQPSKSQRALGLAVAGLLLIAGTLSWILENESITPLAQFPLLRVIVPLIGISSLLTPLAMAFLIARDPIFDPRRILARGLPYALLSGVIAALYLVIVLMGQRLFAAVTGEEAIVFSVVAALIVAFVFAPLRERVQLGLDRLFRRDPRMVRAALDQAGRELLGALDGAEVRASVEAGLTRGLGRPVGVLWPEHGAPRLAPGEDPGEDARSAVENLLNLAGIRLENLALTEERAGVERHAVELREAATRAELRALHAQVQPHFLFNALNTLSYLIETDPPAAQRFVERLADMLRYTVEAGERPHTLLGDEIAFVEDYLGVARERYEGELRFEYRGPRDLLSACVPPLLLQPLVENSLKHGLPPGTARLRLTLDASRENGWLTLRFADDGQPSGNGSGLGVGLENLEQRVRRFAGVDAEVEAGPTDGRGFAVSLRWRETATEPEREREMTK
ncbi:MAG TPA: histidine kinase [Candidatus Limnocylindria bacterium]|nr:histidine kinase [Candidatus Limnocylindria bacterium]